MDSFFDYFLKFRGPEKGPKRERIGGPSGGRFLGRFWGVVKNNNGGKSSESVELSSKTLWEPPHKLGAPRGRGRKK